jgi:secondary thiamine-phosphate synthase enzyme
MPVHTDTISIHTRGDGDVKDITSALSECIRRSGVSNGIASVFCAGSTGALTTTEYEPGAIGDINELLDRLIPPTPPGPPWGDYHHHQTWHDDNGHAHLRASIVGSDITVPIRNGRPLTGTWQQVVFIDFDTRPRHRELPVTIIGE